MRGETFFTNYMLCYSLKEYMPLRLDENTLSVGVKFGVITPCKDFGDKNFVSFVRFDKNIRTHIGFKSRYEIVLTTSVTWLFGNCLVACLLAELLDSFKKC